MDQTDFRRVATTMPLEIDRAQCPAGTLLDLPAAEAEALVSQGRAEWAQAVLEDSRAANGSGEHYAEDFTRVAEAMGAAPAADPNPPASPAPGPDQHPEPAAPSADQHEEH